MPESSGPTVRRRRLAAELRRIRERSGQTEDEVAAEVGWSGSKLSRIEMHRTGIKPADLQKLLDYYHITGKHREDLLDLAKESGRKGWWRAYADSLPGQYTAFIGLEADAAAALSWSSELVYGLLQTEAYARAVIHAHMSSTATISPGELDRRVQARLVRQRLLTRDPPFTLSVVLDESVLLRQFGDPPVMREQLESLVEVSHLPSVALRVLRLAGEHPIGTGPFVLLQFAPLNGVAMHDVVYLEQLNRSSLYIEDEANTYQYALAFERLVAESLDPPAARDLIAGVAREVWT